MDTIDLTLIMYMLCYKLSCLQVQEMIYLVVYVSYWDGSGEVNEASAEVPNVLASLNPNPHTTFHTPQNCGRG